MNVDSAKSFNTGADGEETIPITELPERMAIRLFHVIFMLACLISQVVPAAITGSLPYVMSSLQAEYDVPNWMSGQTISATQLGSVLGVFACGWLADVYGRRSAVIFCTLVCIVTSLTFFIVPGKGWFYLLVFLYVIQGISFGGFATIMTPYCLEFFPDQFRGVAGLITSLGWPAGSIWCIRLVGWVGTENWRLALVLGPLVPALLMGCFLFYVPESPRWLLTVGRVEEGEKALRPIFSSPVLYPRGMAAGPPPKILQVPEEKSEETLKLVGRLFTKDMAYLTIWSSVMYVLTASASFAGWTWGPAILADLANVESIDPGFFAWVEITGVVSCLLAMLILDPLGRRPTMALAYGIGMASYGTLIFGVVGPNQVGYVWLAVGTVQGMMWPAFTTYLAEIFPTKLRGTGNGFAATWGRIGNAVAPIVAGYLLELNVYAALSFILGLYILAFLGSLFIPKETALAAIEDFASS